ncbi:unnamed protein product [Mycena citricolor]|uniref:Uncharacterized protein n=1 Tax=Mycena citricolor TaxID=2018698 RepID=A0AAD2GZ48_9AGAR|nr:unnamed protein product [Mycena citricolor]
MDAKQCPGSRTFLSLTKLLVRYAADMTHLPAFHPAHFSPPQNWSWAFVLSTAFLGLVATCETLRPSRPDEN